MSAARPEEMLRAVLENVVDAVVTIDPRGRIVAWNSAAHRMFGYTEAEAIGLRLETMMPERYRTRHAAGIRRVRNGARPRSAAGTIELHGLTRGGTEFPIELSLTRPKSSDSGCVTGIIRDITQRRRAEASLARREELYTMLSRTNQAVVRSRNRDECLAAICRVAVETGGFGFAWIGLTSPGPHRMRPVASFGDAADLLDVLRLPSGECTCQDIRAMQDVLETGNPAVSNHAQAEAALAVVRPALQRAGVNSLGAFRINQQSAAGLLVVGARRSGVFSSDVTATLEEMAGDIAFALDTFAIKDERARALQEARDSERRYRNLFEANPQAMWIYDPETLRFLAVNDATVATYGWSRQDFLAMTIADIRPAADVPRLMETLAHTSNDQTVRAGTWTHVKRNGDAIDVEITSRHIDHDSRPAKLVLAHDVTARRRAERAMADSESRFRGLVEQSIAGIFVVQQARIVYGNPRLAEILGHPSTDDLIGTKVKHVIVADDYARIVAGLHSVRVGSVSSYADECDVVRGDGSRLRIGLHVNQALHQGQEAVIGMVQDISEKKRTEERVRQYMAQLERAFMNTVGLATTLGELRDPYTAGHERRVAGIAVAIGRILGLDPNRLQGLKVSGHLHDIGKISVPVEILVKPSRLNALEMDLVKQHSQAGYLVLKDVEFPWPVAKAVLQHHERMDGSGYPAGLRGEDIILEARILAVADTVEAMASHRPYRPGLGIATALAEIERGRSVAYDAVVADACLKLFREDAYVIPN